MIRSVARFAGTRSVRARIIVLATIPILGFLASSIAYVTGEAEVQATFERMKRAAALADNSQDFKEALSSMRIYARDFAARPSQDLIAAFHAANNKATTSLHAVEAGVDMDTGRHLDGLNNLLMELTVNFNHLTIQQDILGFTEDDGIRRRMIQAAAAVERIIHEDMSWMRDADAHKLLVSLLTMRRYETEYRLSRTTLLQSEFFDELKSFTGLLDSIIGAAILKQQLSEQVHRYADTFAEWIAVMDKVSPRIALIDVATRKMMPMADEIIASASHNAALASSVLAASQSRTRNVLI